MHVTAIIPAAGAGVRFGGAVKKQFIALDGLPILSHTLRALAASKALSAIIVVVPPGEELRGRKALELARIDLETEVVPGGQARQDSVYIGLQRAKAETDLVLIHDGVRPFVSREVVLATIEAAKEWGAAIAAVPVIDTIKRVDTDGFVVETLQREQLWAVQTPQVFRYALLMRAHRAIREGGIVATDDAALVERIGGMVKVVRGSYENLKITSEEDLPLADLILKRWMVQ
ncbi:2-C-methyl-D-erythritol 4-phosphate cytidylyltransferase [Candidatus Methylomirabilis limnetica]|uniref:2-C-methyl-D-erythritol 4-phosphate cytidylyltransferase n=1 Tax=Candidatus Methylomirabilis limnetica TaxID=2033718 RepID=A0A2T4TXA2_9BACT|nr:2-C-methyl-D-erythritol 4-phosphate cytidylyltransferase [Candidatus Methylomirabilis limnetica]PTL35730.1 2-C-methyl-D-erythritol 4-phosphate cytidylyltransferase [Candidatus Methylomirabilis limnetica]